MKRYILLMLFLIGSFLFSGCGSVVFTYRMGFPAPHWYYPNRIETVRYIYFPELTVYYDLSLNKYIYLENNIWIKATSLPIRYRNVDLRKTKYRRIKNYFHDNIKGYHNNTYKNRRSPTVRRN